MRLLIGVDGSEPSRVACALVASRSWPAGTRVRLVAHDVLVHSHASMLVVRGPVPARARRTSAVAIAAV